MPADSSRWVILNAIRLIVQDLREASRATEAGFGLSGAQLFVLQTLAEAPPMSVNDLAARTYTHQSSVSAVVKKLVQRGLVTMRRSPDDARRRDVSLTVKGRALAKRAPEAAPMHLIESLDKLPAADRRQLATSLKRLTAIMGDGQERRAGMFFER